MRCGGGNDPKNDRSTVLATRVTSKPAPVRARLLWANMLLVLPVTHIVVYIAAFGRTAFPKLFVAYPHHIEVLSAIEGW